MDGKFVLLSQSSGTIEKYVNDISIKSGLAIEHKQKEKYKKCIINSIRIQNLVNNQLKKERELLIKEIEQYKEQLSLKQKKETNTDEREKIEKHIESINKKTDKLKRDINEYNCNSKFNSILNSLGSIVTTKVESTPGFDKLKKKAEQKPLYTTHSLRDKQVKQLGIENTKGHNVTSGFPNFN